MRPNHFHACGSESYKQHLTGSNNVFYWSRMSALCFKLCNVKTRARSQEHYKTLHLSSENVIFDDQ